MKKTIPDTSTDSLPRLLDRIVTVTVAFVAAMRPLSAGQPAHEPETTFLAMLVWFAACLWLLGHVLRNSAPRVPALVVIPLGLYAFATALSVQRVWLMPFAGDLSGLNLFPPCDGNAQAALGLGRVMLTDLALFMLVLDHFRKPKRLRFLAACLLAGLAAVTLFSVYQRLYGLPYFRRTLDDESIARTVGFDPTSTRLFGYRVSSDRVYGPFAYPNALAGYCLLLLPVCGGLAWKRGRGRLLSITLAAGVLALVFSGSKAGFLTAKLIEAIALWMLTPAAFRSRKRAGSILAGVTLATVGCGVIAGAGYAAATLFVSGTETLSPKLIAQILFSGLWLLELKYLALRTEQNDMLPPAARLGGLGALILGMAGTIWLIGGWGMTETTPAPLREAHRVAAETVRVRWNYWVAAGRMTVGYPVRGVGLDQFGSRYTEYKTPEGWAVRKAHNHYLQLAADGGLPLLLAFLALVACGTVAYRRQARGDKLNAGETNTEEPSAFLMPAVMLVVSAFGVIYAGFLVNQFGGLSIEFFYREWIMRPGLWSARGTTGEVLPLLVHGVMHLVLLPCAWIALFVVSRKALSESSVRELKPWLALGVIAVLVHSVADFHLEIASVSFVAWLLAALCLTQDEDAGAQAAPTSRARVPMLLGCLVLAGGFLFWGIVPWMEGSFAVRSAETMAEVAQSTPDPVVRSERIRDASAALAEATAARPLDPALARLRARLATLDPAAYDPRSPGRLSTDASDTVTRSIARAIELDPYNAGAGATLADMLLQSGQPDTDRAARLLERAVALHPYKPVYRLMLGEARLQQGKRNDAATHFHAAQTVNAIVTDERARLSEEEQQRLARLLRMVEG